MTVRVRGKRPGYFFCALLLVCGLAGCGPTYPKEKFRESIVKVCRHEYKLDVKAETLGRTIAIYVPLPDLIDFTFEISKAASEKINDVILSVSRVALSTDASYDFYCVIAHDIRIPEIQIVIIKSVDDVKRFMLNDISRGEYSKRMIIDMRMSPQSQKERAVKEVFEKMGLEPKWQEQVMNDFFRSEPTVLGDIGYWNERFYIKDITLAEFIAEQIANRVRMEFREDMDLAASYMVKSSKGAYRSRGGRRYFDFEILADQKWFASKKIGITPATAPTTDKVTMAVTKVAAHVLHGYRFEDFEFINVLNQNAGRVLKISCEDLEKFRKKKISFEDLMRGQDA